MLDRGQLLAALMERLHDAPAVALLGARQVGKTTLARQCAQQFDCAYFDLEDPQSLASLDQPQAMLDGLLASGRTVVMDEVQRRPDLFPLLRTLIDRHARAGQFLLLGSASPALMQQSGESLAGRLSMLSMGGIALAEAPEIPMADLWLRGGFPRALLAASQRSAIRWLRDYLALVIERDLPQLGLNVAAPVLQRFWRLLAHYHGQTWNAAEPARGLGVSEPTARRYLEFMTGLQLVRQLPPWHENLGKRQVKAPKVYIRDSGLLHYLWGVGNAQSLWQDPRSGASWEGFALEQVLHVAQPDEAYFWATHGGAELDLLMFKHGRRVGVEFKRVDAPRMTPSMHIARENLKLDALYVVYPGERRYAMAETGTPVTALPLQGLRHMNADWN